jgi:hypothetical protein
MMAIAFSLYGSDQRYLIGALENARMAAEFYPGWEVHFWVGKDIPIHTLTQLRLYGATLWLETYSIADGKFWRFLIHDLPHLQRYIVRDVDSRFSRRETEAVADWIDQDTRLHVMRDHPLHYDPILGGMWGLKKQAPDFNMRHKVLTWIVNNPGKGNQSFLAQEIWSSTTSKTIHDSCGAFDGTRNWPKNGQGFVGEYIGIDGSHVNEHRQARLEA